MKLINEKEINNLNLKRLKSYLKKLRIENQQSNRFWWCESCNEYHFPSKKNRTDLEKKIIEDIKKIIKTKFIVKKRISEL